MRVSANQVAERDGKEERKRMIRGFSEVSNNYFPAATHFYSDKETSSKDEFTGHHTKELLTKRKI